MWVGVHVWTDPRGGHWQLVAWGLCGEGGLVLADRCSVLTQPHDALLCLHAGACMLVHNRRLLAAPSLPCNTLPVSPLVCPPTPLPALPCLSRRANMRSSAIARTRVAGTWCTQSTP
jgi:hypothetical protein